MSNKTLLVMAGGTGGHIYPALSIADYLSQIGWNIVWLGTKQGLEEKVVPEAGYKIEWLTVKGVRGKNIKQLLLAPFNIFVSCIQALKILLRIKPNVVLGMGGFVTVPGGLMAALLAKPLVIHEQNAVAGTANNVLRVFARKVLFSFENTFKQDKKHLLIGNPVRKEITSVSTYKVNDKDEINLIVLGGSLGAQTLNQYVPQALALLNKKVNIIHQCGEKHLQAAQENYAKAGIDAKVVAFIKDMHEVYAWADFAICRAGAMTVAELSISAVPAIFIPYPYAIDDHQTRNAQALVDIGGAELLDEKQVSAETLSNKLLSFIEDKEKLANMQSNIQKAAKPLAVQQIAEICIKESRA